MNEVITVKRNKETNLHSKSSTMMTTKELAKTLKVTERTIRNTVVKLGKVLSAVQKNSQGGYLFTEEQATLIKQEIQKHHNLSNRQIDNVTTKTEMMQNIQRDLQWLVSFNAELQKENNLLKSDKEALQIELDQSKEYITIKRMEKLNPKMHFNWRLLKKESENLHKPSKEVFDANYGTVKAYHVDVWESLYFDSINYPI